MYLIEERVTRQLEASVTLPLNLAQTSKNVLIVDLQMIHIHVRQRSKATIEYFIRAHSGIDHYLVINNSLKINFSAHPILPEKLIISRIIYG